MKNKNSVFIATSLDGYIADKNKEIAWLETVANPEGLDMGYSDFTKDMDALLMGRNTFETVCGFDVEWPYDLPVFVLSNSMTKIPSAYQGKAQLVKGELSKVLDQLNQNGYHRLYIDGGSIIQSFLKEDLIDEICITIIPILLGGGIPLFGDLLNPLVFDLVDSQVHLNQLVQLRYRRKK